MFATEARKNGQQQRDGLWRERKTGETERATVKIPPCQNSNIFSTGLTETRVFLGIIKKKKNWPTLKDTDTKQMADMQHTGEKKSQ